MILRSSHSDFLHTLCISIQETLLTQKHWVMWQLALLFLYHKLGLNSWARVKLIWISCRTMITLNELMAICCLSMLLFIEDILSAPSQDSWACNLNKLVNDVLQSWCIKMHIWWICYLQFTTLYFPLQLVVHCYGVATQWSVRSPSIWRAWKGSSLPTLDPSVVSSAMYLLLFSYQKMNAVVIILKTGRSGPASSSMLKARTFSQPHQLKYRKTGLTVEGRAQCLAQGQEEPGIKPPTLRWWTTLSTFWGATASKWTYRLSTLTNSHNKVFPSKPRWPGSTTKIDMLCTRIAALPIE